MDESVDAECATMSRVSVTARLAMAGYRPRWVLTGGGAAAIRVDHGGRSALVGPYGENGQIEMMDDGILGVSAEDPTGADDMVGSEEWALVWSVECTTLEEVVQAVDEWCTAEV